MAEILDIRHIFHPFNNRSYAVPQANAFLPAAAWYLPFYLYFVLCSQSAKRNTKEDEVPLRKITSGQPRNSYSNSGLVLRQAARASCLSQNTSCMLVSA